MKRKGVEINGSSTDRQLAAVVVGLVVTIGLGFGIGPFLKWKIPLPPRPESLKEKDWEALTTHFDYGRYIGRLEALLSFAAFALPAYVILGGCDLPGDFRPI